MKNRLNLDFTLETSSERASYISEYIPTLPSPTQDELQKISNYILWGKNQTGEFANDILLASKWSDSQKVESYDALIESPTFNESQFTNSTPAIIRKKKFSREEARAEAPPSLLPQFELLWRQIDEYEYICTYYDILYRDRVKPIREELVNRIPSEVLQTLHFRAQNLSQYQYLKLKRQLVDLRSEQYTLRDSYKAPPIRVVMPIFSPSYEKTDSISILPVGSIKDFPFLFQELTPSALDDSQLKTLSNILWNEEKSSYNIDFREESTVNEILGFYNELIEAGDRNSEIAISILETLQYYIKEASLTDAQRDILDLKLHKVQNEQIASQINKQYGKSYNTNYISTIYHQKIIKEICAAAQKHREILENIFFPENFKKCTKCGRLLLLNTTNFMRKAKSKDGFATRCKECEKIERNKRGR